MKTWQPAQFPIHKIHKTKCIFPKIRRILCDIIGTDVEAGKIPASEIDTVARMVRDISYNNARNYFGF